jgi:hypothetical protein
MVNPELQLRENRGCPALLNVAKALGLELLAWIENNKIVGLKEPSNIVHADSDVALRGNCFR